MKAINFVILTVALCLILSCASNVKFPVSEVTPGARISARVHTDKNENININVTAKYLASPERLTPSKNIYVVWVKTVSNGTINIGQLQSESSKKSTLKTITPFDPVEIFITAEDDGSVKWPEGLTIAKTRI